MKSNSELARQFVSKEIMTDGMGRKATRLVMEYKAGQDGTGLCEGSIVDSLTKFLDANLPALTPVAGPPDLDVGSVVTMYGREYIICEYDPYPDEPIKVQYRVDSTGEEGEIDGPTLLGDAVVGLRCKKIIDPPKPEQTTGEKTIEPLRKFTEALEQTSTEFLVDPGAATPEEIANLFSEISKLYQMYGGSGIRFRVRRDG